MDYSIIALMVLVVAEAVVIYAQSRRLDFVSSLLVDIATGECKIRMKDGCVEVSYDEP